MILVDMNQVMISNLMASIGGHHNVEIQEDLIRHMVLNSLRTNRQKFHSEYGELVICCDDRNYWRKKLFPYYKANRKTTRQQSELDWSMIFGVLNQIREDLRNIFPYKVIQVDTAEADDIIATIVHEHGTVLTQTNQDKILILSGDKDFIQLHTYGNVSQYDPVRKRFIKNDDPQHYLKEHIARGDRGDGVPNILSQDDCFINGRQKPLRTKFLNTVTSKTFEEIENGDDDYKTNWNRNRRMVDLSLVPQDIQDQVLEDFSEDDNTSRDKLFNYFVQNKLKNLMEHIGDF
jgi:hypothetical protein|tara:strand:+ start:4628 stop:5497 length:870 start_codon:yes stop_codon:yes gene_type:complete